MSTWAGVAPAIGTGSLDGFAIGALMSGACVLGITAPRRVQARAAPRARAGAGGAERSGGPGARARAGGGAGAGGAGGAFPAWGSLRGADPGVTFPDKALADRAFESPKRREVRRLPQHAAPSVSFSSRVAGFGSRISSLFPARALASGARG